MPQDRSGVILTDGSLDWSGGVDSITVPTIESPRNPNGLKRNQLAWLDGGTVRDGGISPRGGFSRLGVIHDKTGLFQGQFMYEPLGADPYLIVCISGHVYQVIPGTPPTITDLTAAFPGTGMPAIQPHFYFVQGEEFLVIQAGDNVTLPLIWDGNILRRSKGITNTAVAPGTPGVNEIPAATAMTYYMGRIWYAQGRQYSAGDIVGGNSGTLAYNFRDSILNITENPLVLGGDGFTVPTNAGNIRSLFFNAQLNQQLGQGQLLIGTRKAVYALQVPVSRADWIAATSTNQPIQTVVQLVNGPVGDRSVVQVNGDVFYQSLEPSIRSLFASVRYFNQWGNIEISAQENRVLQFNDRSLLSFSTGMVFNNRLLMSALPKQIPQGVIHQALVPLDFIPISTLGPNEQPVWEGMYESLNYLQLNSGDFGGLERGFATVVSGFDGGIELWELSYVNPFDSNRFDPESRIDWYFETPSFTWGDEFLMKELLSAELWVDRISGTVLLQMDYRPDGQTCWLNWTKWELCSAKNSCEDTVDPVCYPITEYGEGNRQTFTLPKPPDSCQTQNRRPSNQGYQFQFRLTIKGFCRVRGLMFKATARDQALYQNLVCESGFGCLPITAPARVPTPIPTPTPTPTPPPTPPAPASSGWKIQNLASVESQLVQQPGPVPACGASTYPAWDGVFNIKVTGGTGIIYWYFINQSINGLEVAGNKATHYPTGNWMDTDAFAQLYFQGGVWHLWLVCTVGNELWFGNGTSTDPTNPAGVYTALDSPTPATITIVSA